MGSCNHVASPAGVWRGNIVVLPGDKLRVKGREEYKEGGNATVVVYMSDREASAIGVITGEAVSPPPR